MMIVGWFGKRRAPPEPVCFVCDGSAPALDRDGPGHWLSPRGACRAHCEAALLSSGELLAGFLGRHTSDHPLEGSGLGWLLNPVSIAGERAWADFAAGGWAVLEEVFASDSQCDFWAQHSPECVDALYRMYPPTGARAGRLARRLGGGPAVVSRGDFIDQWEFHRRIEHGFRRRGTRDFTSPGELLEIWDFLHLPGEEPVPFGGPGFDEYLRRLAARRFQVLRGAA